MKIDDSDLLNFFLKKNEKNNKYSFSWCMIISSTHWLFQYITIYWTLFLTRELFLYLQYSFSLFCVIWKSVTIRKYSKNGNKNNENFHVCLMIAGEIVKSNPQVTSLVFFFVHLSCSRAGLSIGKCLVVSRKETEILNVHH